MNPPLSHDIRLPFPPGFSCGLRIAGGVTGPLSVVGDKSEDPRAHRLVEGSDSEEEDNVPVGPLEGEEPPQLPTASIAPGVNRLDNEPSRSFIATSEKSAHTIFSDEDEPVPTLNPVEKAPTKEGRAKTLQPKSKGEGGS